MHQTSNSRRPPVARTAASLIASPALRAPAHRLPMSTPLLAPLLLAAGMALHVPAAQADTASISTPSITSTMWPDDPARAGGLPFTTFTSTGGPNNYITGLFSVGGGSYSLGVTYNSPGAGNIIYVLNSPFTPSSTAANITTQFSKFIVGKYSTATGNTLAGVNLASGQYYYLVVIGAGPVILLTLSGTGCVSFSSACVVNAINVASLSSNALAGAAWNDQLGSFDRISSRLEALRFAQGSTDTAPVAYAMDSMTGMAAGDVAPRQGLWTRAIGGDQSQSSNQAGAGYKGRAWGLAAGYDRALNEALTVGVALAYSTTNYGFQDQWSDQSARVKNTQFAAYASHDFRIAYADAMLGYSQQRYSVSRGYGANTGSFGGELWSARLGAGVPLALTPRTTLVPQARLDYGRMQQDAYSESGAAALTVAPRHAERLRSSLGAQLNYNMQIGKLKVQPYARAFWNHEFKNNGLVSSANLNGTDLTISGQALPRETYTAGLGATMLVNASFSALLGYDYDFGGGYKANTVKATARWVF